MVQRGENEEGSVLLSARTGFTRAGLGNIEKAYDSRKPLKGTWWSGSRAASPWISR